MTINFVSSVLKFYINAFIDHLLFSTQLFLLNIMLVRFIYVAACSNSLFILIAVSCSILWICPNMFTHSPIHGQVELFKFGVIRNKDALNLFLHAFWWTTVFISLGYTCRNGIWVIGYAYVKF